MPKHVKGDYSGEGPNARKIMQQQRTLKAFLHLNLSKTIYDQSFLQLFLLSKQQGGLHGQPNI